MNYIFFSSIGGWGGHAIYIRNKIEYLEQQGWNVIVFHPQEAIQFSELRAYGQNMLVELSFDPFNLLPFSRSRVIQKIRKRLNLDGGETIIESNEAILAVWAELLANELDCRHLVFPTSEDYYRTKPYLPFFHYKLERGEFAGISAQATRKFFKDYRVLSIENAPALTAVCSNVLADVEYQLPVDIRQFDFVIGSIGRLDKSFVKEMVRKVGEFAQKYATKRILFLFIGDPRIASFDIPKELSGRDNVKPIFTGILFPIPRTLVKSAHTFISIAGSAVVSANEGVPTIIVDADDHYGIGVLGHTTENTTFRSSEPKTDLVTLLEDVLLLRPDFFRKHPVSLSRDLQTEFAGHLDFIRSAKDSHAPHPLRNQQWSWMRFVKGCTVFFLGFRVVRWVGKLITSEHL